MSLITKMMESCILLNKIRTPDGYGGYHTVFEDGVEFDAAIIKNNSNEAVIAEKQGVTETFTVVVRKGFELDYHDAFRRVRDGEVFRVTGKTTDNEAPESSTVKISKATAERWALPDE